jgi:hypothetical protein
VAAPEPGPASHLEELPPQGTDLVDAPRRPVAPFTDDASMVGPRRFGPPAFEGPPSSRFAALPPWLRIALPVLVVVVLAVVGFLVLGGSGGEDALSTSDAAALARQQIDTPIPEAKVASLVDQMCGAAETGTAAPVVILAKQLPVTTRTELRAALGAMGTAAERHCPDLEVDWGGLVDDVYLGAAPAFAR